MLAKRIIPCLDVDQGRVVKGVNFVNLIDAGDPVELAKFYNKEGADELVFLDITASSDNRETIIEIVKKVAKEVFIPFTVGGGINNLGQIKKIIGAGAEKVSLNTAAVKNPELITEAAENFGSQCIVLAIDAKKIGNSWKVFIKGGREETDLEVIDWAKQGAKKGAGEILLTSMDKDGTKSGFDIELTKAVSEAVNIPVIASGGAGQVSDFTEVLKEGKADAALAASLFHFGEIKIADLKTYLKKSNIEIREASPRRRGSKNMNLDFQKGNGLIPAIIQDDESGEVLMLGFMNEEAFQKTLETNLVHFFSRSRQKLWMKGEESGDKLEVKEIFADCDKDTILVKVKMLGNAVCHTGKKSCFFEEI